MLRRLSIFCLAFGFCNGIQSSRADNYPPSQVGPTSAEESMLLWMEGKSAFEKRLYPDAIRNLQRIVDRYPGTRAYTDAHFYLGLSYLRVKEPSKAIPHLKFYTQSKLGRSEMLDGKLSLSRAFLDAKKFHEGLLTSEEVLEMHRKEPVRPDVFGQALLLKAWAMMGLKKWPEAGAVMDAFLTSNAKDAKSPLIQTEAIHVQARIKSHECAGYPKTDKRGKAKEADVRADLVKRGNCVLEVQTLLMRSQETDIDSPWTAETRNAVKAAFADYEKACGNPPPPANPVNSVELKKYKSELAEALKKDCAEALARRKADL